MGTQEVHHDSGQRWTQRRGEEAVPWGTPRSRLASVEVPEDPATAEGGRGRPKLWDQEGDVEERSGPRHDRLRRSEDAEVVRSRPSRSPLPQLGPAGPPLPFYCPLLSGTKPSSSFCAGGY